MNRLCVTLATLPLFAAALAAQSHPSAWNLAQPDAKALIGIDVRSLQQSSAAESFGSLFGNSAPGMMQFPGMEILTDIDQVFISSPGVKTKPAGMKTGAAAGASSGAKSGAPTNKAPDNPPFLMVLTGHFPPDHVASLARGTHHLYHAVNIYSMSDDNQTHFATLDPQTLLLGDEPSLRDAIDRRGQPPASLNPLLIRAAAIAATHDFWLITNVSPADFQPSAMDLGPFVSDIQGLDLGVSVRDGLHLEVNVATKTPQAAHELAQMFSTQVQMAMASGLDAPQSAQLAKKLQIGSEGTQMRVNLALSKEELNQQIGAMQSARARAAASGMAAETAVPATASTPAKPRTVKIYGLDEGVREIPLSSPSK